MEKIFEKSYDLVTDELDNHMNVEVYRKQSIMTNGYEIDTLIAEVSEDGGFVFVVTADVTGVEEVNIIKAMEHLWTLVNKGVASSMNSKWLEPIAEQLTDGAEYQTNTVGFRVLCD